jgi:hypothetical protein
MESQALTPVTQDERRTVWARNDTNGTGEVSHPWLVVNGLKRP